MEGRILLLLELCMKSCTPWTRTLFYTQVNYDQNLTLTYRQIILHHIIVLSAILRVRQNYAFSSIAKHLWDMIHFVLFVTSCKTSTEVAENVSLPINTFSVLM